MEVTITFNQGPLEAEIHASDEDDYRKILDDLADFVNKHPELVEKPNPGTTPSQTTGGRSDQAGDEAQESEGKVSSLEVENEMLRPVLRETNIDEESFIRVFEVHKDVTPRILNTEILPGDSPGKMVLNASAILLTLWQECYDETWMKSSDLSDTLEQSGISDRTDYIYNQSNWQSLFDKQGEGRGTKLRVTRLGKDEGVALMKEMVS